MKKVLFILFLASPLGAAVMDVRCVPAEEIGGSIPYLQCSASADDLDDSFSFEVSGVRMRVNGNGNIIAGDIAGIRAAMSSAMNTAYSAALADLPSRAAAEAKRRITRGDLSVIVGQVLGR